MENQKKVQNLLENVIRASGILMEKGYLEKDKGKEMLRCLTGIRQRFLSEEYMKRSPLGAEIDEIDKMILPLDRMLVEAGKKGYTNTISYILKTVVQGTGVGHRILTEEERKEPVLTLLRRKMKVEEYLEDIQNAWQLDEKLSSKKNMMKRQQMLHQNYQKYEQKIAQIKKSRPDIIEEVLYYTDLEKMSPEALAYIDMAAAMAEITNGISETEDDLDKVECLIRSYQQALEQTRQWDRCSVQNDVEKEPEQQTYMDTDNEPASDEEDSLDDEILTEQKIREMQKLIEKFVDEDNPDVLDFEYQEMERIFDSREMKEYVSESWHEFEKLGLAHGNKK